MNTIGKYKICGLLGRGGMSKVYKVQLPVVGKITALKLLDPDPLLVDLIGMNKIRDLFISEAKKNWPSYVIRILWKSGISMKWTADRFT